MARKVHPFHHRDGSCCLVWSESGGGSLYAVHQQNYHQWQHYLTILFSMVDPHSSFLVSGLRLICNFGEEQDISTCIYPSSFPKKQLNTDQALQYGMCLWLHRSWKYKPGVKSLVMCCTSWIFFPFKLSNFATLSMQQQTKKRMALQQCNLLMKSMQNAHKTLHEVRLSHLPSKR